MNRWRAGRWLFVAGLVAASAWPSLVAAQGLGEVAQKEKARRQGIARQEQVRTYTENDLAAFRRLGSETPGGSFTTVTATSAASAGAKEAPSPSPAEKGADVAYWEERLEIAQEAVDRLQREVWDLEAAVREAQSAPPDETYDDALNQAAQRQQLVDEYVAAKQDLVDALRDLTEARLGAQQVG